MIYWIGFVISFLLIILSYAIYLNGFFKRNGIQSASRCIPLFGNMGRVFFGLDHISQTVRSQYKKQGNNKFFGFMAFNNPVIVIKDPDLIKQITVKDFDSFLDHIVFMDEEDEPLFGRNLFFLRGQKWRDMRIAMSPAYTGSKMKNMFPFVLESSNQMVEYFENEIKSQKDLFGTDYIDVEMKDAYTRFTNDTIASTAFGIKINSFLEKSNEFYLMGKKATDFSGVQFLKFFGYASFPAVMKALNIPLFPNNVRAFFRNIVKDSMETRESSGHIRPDMIHLLMLAKKGTLSYDMDEQNTAEKSEFIKYTEIQSNGSTTANKREWSHDDLTAQALAFLLAGFDTSSSLLCFTSYELAVNPDIQVRLQHEIDDLLLATDNQPNYMDIQKLKYLDMVVSESLRMWPPDSQLERLCTKPYKLPKQNDSSETIFEIPKGSSVWIPTFSIHHDPKNYPDPERFDPERFSDENKPLIHPATFIPFGIGPRLCIGARFAVMEAKVLIFKILSKFDIIKTVNTVVPLQLATDTFIMHSQNGFRLGLKLRK